MLCYLIENEKFMCLSIECFCLKMRDTLTTFVYLLAYNRIVKTDAYRTLK